MSLIAKQSGGSSLAPIEAGTHPAVCVGIIDIGSQYNEKYKKSQPKVIIQFEVTDETITVDGKEVNRTMSSTYTNTLNERGALYRDLIAWRGKPFTDEELAGFNLSKILGVPCLLTVTHQERNGSTYANVSAISKAMKGMEIKPTLPLVTFDIDDDPLEKVADFPEWIQKKIQASEQYKERTAGSGNDSGEEYDGPPAFTDEDDPGEGQLPF